MITEQFCIAPYKLQNENRGGKSLTKLHCFTVSFFKLCAEYIDYRLIINLLSSEIFFSMFYSVT